MNDGLPELLMRVYENPFASEHDPRSLLRRAATALLECRSRVRELEDLAAESRHLVASLRSRVTELESSVASDPHS